MSDGGQLIIGARNVGASEAPPGLSGEYVAIAVQDTGCGIPDEILDRVFEPFFTTKEVGRGTGLGLSQVYGFARQSGGTAIVESQQGRGTRVTIYLPRTFDESASASPAEAAEELRFTGKVLLVEDNRDVWEVTRGLLEDLGFSVDLLSDAESALRHLQTSDQAYRFLLSDIVMPGPMNGLELARRVRELPGTSLPIILATGYSAQAQAASDEGFVLLRKPYGVLEIRKAAATVLPTAVRQESHKPRFGIEPLDQRAEPALRVQLSRWLPLRGPCAAADRGRAPAPSPARWTWPGWRTQAGVRVTVTSRRGLSKRAVNSLSALVLPVPCSRHVIRSLPLFASKSRQLS